MSGGTSPRFVKLRGLTDPNLSRMQDNVDATLGPIASALVSTPIMGAAPPPWVRVDLTVGWTTQPTTSAAYSTPAFHRDALGYVHIKGFILNTSGGALSTAAFVLPMGYRPKEAARFVVEGTGLSFNVVAVTPDGAVTPQTAVINNGGFAPFITFLAEQ